MPDPPPDTVQLRGWLERLQAGDRAASDELIRHVCDRLERMARRMLNDFPGVRRWAETGDVLQSALMRLLRALRAVRPDSMRAFFALAAEQVRRELLDLARHFYGPEGAGAHHASLGDSPPDPSDHAADPGRLAEWCEFHRQTDQLPDDEREVVDLLFYQGLTQPEAAAVLEVTVRTVQRRWQSALLKLHRLLKGDWLSP
jgi:RNA polymerase sigma-70 factor (ECF subfamily)